MCSVGLALICSRHLAGKAAFMSVLEVLLNCHSAMFYEKIVITVDLTYILVLNYVNYVVTNLCVDFCHWNFVCIYVRTYAYVNF